MSFSQALPITEKTEVEQALREMQSVVPLNAVAQKLFDAGKSAAAELAAELPDGDATHVSVSISGHGYASANDGDPYSGINIWVREVPAPVIEPGFDESGQELPTEEPITDDAPIS